VVPAHKRGTSFSPEDHKIIQPFLDANIIYMGADSPTYAVHQLKDCLAWSMVWARHRLGATLVFACAGTIGVIEFALPDYEIYKVGEDARIFRGLNLFAEFGMSFSLIPNWNNSESGVEVDASRCFVGKDRFKRWCGMVPPGRPIIGLE
jgi:hypothetical protein